MSQTLNLHVTPKASSNRIKIEEQADGAKLYRVYVTVTPEDGKANEAVLKLLAKELKVSKMSLKILQGHKGRRKVVEVQDV